MLREESKAVLRGAVLLEDLALKFDDKTATYRRKIKDVEHEADEYVGEIHRQLNTSFITPIDHEDIADLANTYDDVLDYIYSIVNRLYIYDIKKVDATIKALARVVREATEEIDSAFAFMKKLSERDMEKSFIKVHALETEADDILDTATAELFKKKNFVQILKYKEIYEILESTTDKCEDVVDILRNIVLKHS